MFSQVIRGIGRRPEPPGSTWEAGQIREEVAGSNPVTPTSFDAECSSQDGFPMNERFIGK